LYISKIEYRIEFTPQGERDLRKLTRRDQRRVASRIDALAINPLPSGVRKLKGGHDIWRLRVGDFRVLYTVAQQIVTITVVRIRHRREVYRR
jgi:mRNA interferase RelE/StbE